MNRLDDKVVLITGTGGGQGRAAALMFAAAGAHVIGCDINSVANRETVDLVKKAGFTMVGFDPVDLGDPDGARRWVEESAAVHGRIDVLYNNASAARFAPFEEFPIADWNFTVRNELDIVFYATRFAWPWLKRRGGVVLNIASVAGIAGSGPGGAAHAATKGAVIALTKHLAMEGAPHGIRVVAISPGFIATPGTVGLLNDAAVRESLLAHNLIKRVGQPEDVVGVALMLVSDAASYMTGANVVIDGGRTVW